MSPVQQEDHPPKSIDALDESSIDPADQAGTAEEPAGTTAAAFLGSKRFHIALLLSAWTVGALALPQIGADALGPLGLASALPWAFYAALGLVLGGFVIALSKASSVGVLRGYVTALALLLHGLSPVVYEFMRFPWAWKHVGIVDFIQRTGSVDRHIESLSAYHNWPGFFGLNALATDLSGFDSPLAYSAWAQLFFNLVYLVVLYVIFRRFTDDRRLVALGMAFFTIGNWVGQDYFAPQAVAFLFYLMIVAILLQWFDIRRSDTPDMSLEVRERNVLGAALVLIITAMVVTHQLTPVMTILMLAGLTVLGGVRIKWPLIAATLITGLWLASFARPFVDDYLPRVIADLGNIGGRVDDGLIDYGQVDTSQRYVSLAARGLTAALGLLAGLGFLRAFRKSRSWRTIVPLAAAPLLLVVASSYGDEIVFRAFLFALPMLALFAAALWFPDKDSRFGWIGAAVLFVVLAPLSFASVVAMHGNDIHSVFSSDEVEAAGVMYDRAAPGSAVIQFTNSYPTKFRNYEVLEELDVASFAPAAKERFLSDPALWFSTWLTEGDYSEGYVFLTKTQSAEVRRVGLLPNDAPDRVEESLRASPSFVVVHDSEDATLFQLNVAGAS